MASTDSSSDAAMEVVEESKQEAVIEVEDPIITSFEALDQGEKLNVRSEDYLLLLQNPREDDVALKIKEQCVYRLANIFTVEKRFGELLALIKENNSFFGVIPKAKTAKIVRNILNNISVVPDSLDTQIQISKDLIEWCAKEKRSFLRQRIEAKLADLLLKVNKPAEALTIVDTLLRDLRKLDDKQMLTEVHLTESRIYHALENIPKSKASLTASRTAAHSIYVVPLLQAELDEMSGTLHCEESDYSTAYSYFLEAFEAYDNSKTSRREALDCMKHMLLTKILDGHPHEVSSLLASKNGVKYAGIEVEAMHAIAKASKLKSLEDFQTAVKKYEQYLKSDNLIAHHLDLLYERMLENNLLKIIKPFSCVELSHVAKLIMLPEQLVIEKLSQMILDHKFYGILDQGFGHLIIYESAPEDTSFARSLDIVHNMGSVVEALKSQTKLLAKTHV